jgi:hopanoid biosynthesis associated RND transporter like protein HpnN
MSLSQVLAALVGFSQRHARIVVSLGVLVALLAGWIGSSRLGISTDTSALFSASLPWRQREMAWDRAFPQSKDLLVAVVDATIPEIADQTANDLATAIAADTAHFREVRRPDASPYFDRNGLLFLDQKTLGEVLDRTIDAQPFLGQLVADPSARGLFAALRLLALGAERGEGNLAPFAASLRAFHGALAAAAAGHPVPLSWQRLIGGSAGDKAGPYRFVLAQVQPDFGALQPGATATAALRAAIARLEFVRAGEAHVRVTGGVALADEEFGTVAQGMVAGTLGSVALISLWLTLALRSWRLIVPVLLTLALGLSLTAAFAALAVGTLNLVSVAFAILFVGIAVDFAIQITVRFRNALFRERDVGRAFVAVGAEVGPEVFSAAAAAACGFLAFVPTSFAGVAELGLIAGVGMLIALACTILFLPGAVALLRPRPEAASVGVAAGEALEAQLVRARRPVLGGFALLAVAGAALVPTLRFDSDPLHTKNPNTEAMRTLADLLASPLTDPYSADILAPSQAAADALAVRLKPLPLVAEVLTLSSFVPGDQPAKLALLADANEVLAATLTPPTPAAPVTAADLRMAASTTRAHLERAFPKLPPDDPLRAIAGDLGALAAAPDATLLAANTALVRFLPVQLDRLRAGLAARPVMIADIPEAIGRDWRLPDGRARVQVLGTAATRDSAGLHALVAEVRTVAPDAGGTAVGIVESADTIITAFRDAAIYALLAIAAILALALRRVLDVALVLAPLLLSALLTVVVITVGGLSLNFANVIALPLLFGVGVSFNVYFVMNWRAGADRFLSTATARAILFSALTTSTAFGSLALSGHPGTSSMGVLLLISLGCTLVATFFFLPTLLRTLGPATGRAARAG